jgi:hypothetical protein
MLMHKIYEGAESHLKSISLNCKFKLTDPALFYKNMLYMFFFSHVILITHMNIFEMFYMC